LKIAAKDDVCLRAGRELVFRAGELSKDARDYIQDRLAELGITPQ
jgi:hypothetical protein